MIHQLWETKQWERATEEEVISALFNPPAFLDPSDMGKIRRYHPDVKNKYLNLFYSGSIPEWCKKLNN
jgi:hypothetical protein